MRRFPWDSHRNPIPMDKTAYNTTEQKWNEWEARLLLGITKSGVFL